MNLKICPFFLSLFLMTALLVSPALSSNDDLSIKGKVYFDAYYVTVTATNFNNKNGEFSNLVGSLPSESSGRGGFQIRRIYLTFQKKLSEKISARIRFETGNSSYKYNADKSMIPFVKDAWLKIKLSQLHSTVLGIQAPPTLLLYEEKLWRYRAVEKVPEDLYKIRSSRDFGVSLKGNFESLNYSVMFGNGKGSETESQTFKEVKTLYLNLNYFFSKSLFIELYGDIDLIPDSFLKKDTSHILIGYISDKIRTGFQYIYQESGKSVLAKYINIISIPFVLNISKNLSILARFDNRTQYSPSIKATVGKMKDNFIILGADALISKNVHLIPNVEIGTYSYEKNNSANSSLDAVARLTLYFKY